MKTLTTFFNQTLTSENSLNRFQMNAIRGGSNTGAYTHIDEDILLLDPIEEEDQLN